MPNIPQAPVPMLGQRAEVQINNVRLLPIAGVQFAKGGCDMPGRHVRLEVVDIPQATQLIIPLDISFAERLHKQLGELINDHNKHTLEGQ